MSVPRILISDYGLTQVSEGMQRVILAQYRATVPAPVSEAAEGLWPGLDKDTLDERIS